MAVIERSFTVKTPREQVFAYLIDHAKDPEWLPGLTDARNFKGEGTDYEWDMTYKMAGISLVVAGRVIEHDPPRRHVIETRSGVVSTWDWTLEPDEDGTRVSLKMEYTVPMAAVGKIAEKMLLKQNEKAATEGMENLQRILEG
jgi:carbon monoxide dehydrogenase subunit G